MDPDFAALIRKLSEKNVDCVIIGGVAMAAHGSAYTTEDFDIAYGRDPENIQKLVAALKPLHPRLRVEGEPHGIPFSFDARTIANGGNFTLLTDAGAVDLLSYIDGFHSYADVKATSQSVQLFGCKVAVLTIEGLIRAKRASARPKDLLAIPELEALKDAERNDR